MNLCYSFLAGDRQVEQTTKIGAKEETTKVTPPPIQIANVQPNTPESPGTPQVTLAKAPTPWLQNKNKQQEDLPEWAKRSSVNKTANSSPEYNSPSAQPTYATNAKNVVEQTQQTVPQWQQAQQRQQTAQQQQQRQSQSQSPPYQQKRQVTSPTVQQQQQQERPITINPTNVQQQERVIPIRVCPRIAILFGSSKIMRSTEVFQTIVVDRFFFFIFLF